MVSPVFIRVRGCRAGSALPRLLFMVVVMAAGVGGGFFLARRNQPPPTAGAAQAAEPQAAQPTAATGATVAMELGQFLVNVEGASAMHYLRVDVAVEVDAPPEGARQPAHGEGEGGREKKASLSPEAELRAKDVVVRVLSSARFESLRTPEGKEKLKARLLEGLQEALPQPKPRGVLFVSFVMQ